MRPLVLDAARYGVESTNRPGSAIEEGGSDGQFLTT
jgi:hypothetical protein